MEELRIGIYVCWCGSNIANIVDVKQVVEEVKTLSDVTVATDYKYMCSDPGQDLLVNDIKKHKLNRIVVASCSPRIHELTFRKALEKAGLNPYLFQMANIREQDSWVHKDREYATEKAVSLIKAAVKRVRFHEPLSKRLVDINPATLIIGGGIAGITAALEIADAGKKVFLVEKEKTIGGNVANIDLTYPYMQSAQQILSRKITRVLDHHNIEVYADTQLKEIFGYIGNFKATIIIKNKKKEIQFGNIIVATGLKTFDPSVIPEYKYGVLPDVITSTELEQMFLSGEIVTKSGKVPEHIAIIHCVGSRSERYHPYCSRTCCSTALKYSLQLTAAIPHANIFELYADMRAYGKGCEDLFTKTSERNVMFLMFNQNSSLPKIRKNTNSDNHSMCIEVQERLSGELVEVSVDMVVLMTAVEAHKDSGEVAHLTGISKCGDDFFIERHPKLDPVATATNGVYLAGSCQGPKGISESINQAKAAATRVLASIMVGKMEVEVTTASVNEDICCGCQTCIMVCPYKAIHFDEDKKVSVVNEVLCKGCGTCGSTCPTGAIKSKHFTDLQILSQIEGLLEKKPQTV